MQPKGIEDLDAFSAGKVKRAAAEERVKSKKKVRVKSKVMPQ